MALAMPHEVFITAVINDADANKARAILAGITEMKERHQYLLVRHFERGPADRDPKILDSLKEYQKERGPNAARWQQFAQTLLRQEYIVQEHIDVTTEVAAANGGDIPLTFPPSKPRLLRWDDFPDPPGNAIPEFITQRRILEITDPRVEKILTDIKFVPRNTSIQESYKWWSNSLEYHLAKVLLIPQGQAPNLATLQPLAPFWTLYVRSEFDYSPERLQESYAALAGVREILQGVIEFKVFDRRAMDTRVMGQR
ncbi:hypothetical protein QBC34DRAFT_389864 [Podospora aff. communis PSN243]|uniref:Mediator of RNA polymerase II transcription subunit 18 n=1 Tax=Podospora aff. communis PSN243 TaxID=3040156 RepID=A0AAV9H612_9PEZI|nr:hypothetical protein QBC34DRAFT_389864 [Podospora aff. communis PSN243]